MKLPDKLEKFISEPYGGLFGNNVKNHVVEEIVADPQRSFRPKDFEELTEKSAPRIRKALKELTELGLIHKDESDSQHPVFSPNHLSKTLFALTMLSLAILDDRDKTELMKEAIIHHCHESGLVNQLFPAAFGSYERSFVMVQERFTVFPYPIAQDSTDIVEY